MTLFVLGCKKKPPEPTELYNKYRSSVALIQNSYYFKTSLDNGFEFYYTIENNKPVFFDEEQEAMENAGISYGTGFFISEKGELATNRHVVYPSKENELVGEGINAYLNDLKYKIKKAINEKETEQSKLVDVWNEYYDYLDYEKKTKLKEEYSTKKNDVIEFEQLLEKLDFNPDNTTTELKRVFLGIAFDDTHITSFNDFQECVAIKKASRDEVDLAIIQLKDKTTPTKIKNTFSLTNKKDFEPIKINDNVYMIGFNHGISLANTGNGIKSQFTQGTITQDPDNNRVLYSIPTLPGSSGSPIIDKWGNLVAVNYAKTGDFQGFSFGIPAVHLTSLYDNSPIINVITDENKQLKNVNENKKETKISNTKSDYYYENQIKGLLKAEDNRDFSRVIEYYDLNNLKRYWDNSNPSYDDLSKVYYKSWSATSNSSNSVNSIDKEWERIFDVNLNYKFYNKRKEEWKTINSIVRVVFGQNDKIIEVYGIENNLISKESKNKSFNIINVSSQSISYCNIKRIENKNNKTEIEFEYTSPYSSESGWISISPKTYILDLKNNRKYKIKDLLGTEFSPNRKSVPYNRKVYFTLLFEQLPDTSNEINIIECPSSNCFNFYNVKIK